MAKDLSLEDRSGCDLQIVFNVKHLKSNRGCFKYPEAKEHPRLLLIHTRARAAREWPRYTDPISSAAPGFTMLVDKSNHVIPLFHIHPPPPPPYVSQ